MVLHHISRRANGVRLNCTLSLIGRGGRTLRLAKSRLRRLLAGRPLRWVCAPLRDNVANGNISLQTPVQVDFAIEHNLFFPSDRARACRDWLLPPMVALPHACLPVRWWIRFAAAKPRWLKQPTGLFLKATFRIHNHLPPKQKKDIPFGMSFCFGGRWWIRTTEVIDDRFTVCSLWPLGKPSIFDYQLDWSWWTDLNPRPADYKSAALPTELHQRFVKPSVSATYI